jgi:hypothetical protein
LTAERNVAVGKNGESRSEEDLNLPIDGGVGCDGAVCERTCSYLRETGGGGEDKGDRERNKAN